MSLKTISNLSHTLSFRLTLWYAGIFIATTVILLSLFYYGMRSQVLKELDEQLAEEIIEFKSILAEGGLDEVFRYMIIEIESESEDTFFRVISKKGRVVKLEKNFSSDKIDSIGSLFEQTVDTGENIFTSLEMPGYPHKMRVVTGEIGQGFILQVGEAFPGYEKLLSLFEKLVLMVAFPLFVLSAVIGWFLARQALRGMEKVTLTAEEIAKGAFDKRVRLHRSTLEVKRLADTFNTMLDQIQSLIKGMKEVTDNIAHDLRSPIARIRGKAEMALVNPGILEDYEEIAVNTVEECDNLIDMINTMLEITEMESGVNKSEKNTVAVKHLILSACEMFTPVAREKKVELRTRLPEDELYLHGDRHKLQRLISNLIENGIKYNRSGGFLEIKVTRENNNLYIQVADTGYGILEEDLPRIFDRFYRGNRSRSDTGSGLGLCLARAIARSFGGEIHVKSRVNQGSIFTVTLPLYP